MTDDRAQKNQTLETLLVRFFKESDAQAIGEFIRLTRPRLLTIARRILQGNDAEDAVQSAYFALMQRGKPLPEGIPVEGWLVTAVVRIAYRHKQSLNRESQREPFGSTPVWGYASPCSSMAMGEEISLVRGEIEKLPSKYRDPVVLHYFEGLSMQDIATALGAGVSSVKMRLLRARNMLRERLEPRVSLELFGLPEIDDEPEATAG